MRGRNLRYALAAMGVAGIVALVVLGVSRPASTGPAAATTATATATATATLIPIVLRTPVPVGTPETADTATTPATTTAPILALGQTVGAGTYRIVGADKPGVVFTVPAGSRITFSMIEVSLCLGWCGGDAIVLTNFANDQEWLCILSISLEECGRNVVPSDGTELAYPVKQSGDSDSGGTGAMFDAIIDSARPGP